MMSLALRSLRHRPGGFVASFLVMFLGATMLMSFASMLDTAQHDAVDAGSEETLTTLASVIGGWGLLLVVFAVTSTLTLSVQQRGSDMALLRSVGATPAQVGRMIVGEAVVLSVLASLLAVPGAMFAGRALLDVLIDTDQVLPAVSYRFGPVGLSMGVGITLVAAVLAAWLAARRTARARVAEAVAAAATGKRRLGKIRVVAAVLFMAGGINLGVLTMVLEHGKTAEIMQTAGSASILVAIGLALLAPLLIRGVTGLLGGPLQRFTGVSGYLTVQNVRRRADRLGTVLMPIILFVGIGTGTFYMQAIENAATTAEGITKTNEQRNIETLNFVVIGTVVLFACIMLVNVLIAATTHRGREFGQQRLIGATPRQVLRMVGAEGVLLAVTGVLFGTIASLATVVPFTVARTEDVVPDTSLTIYLTIVAIAAVVTMLASTATARRRLRTPAVEAVAA
ncbi:FtsX-like permease family protein [Streptomyces sp. AC512_CC834]|uniref:FtsX-like permease family protein n=1 Tax=Streptomyces sp. AC512_CC834 TaxID=2823691 RepID=UPI001C2734AE|nr:FtsX-like permease family protein [Streptomyces sp. AC512_CC834]